MKNQNPICPHCKEPQWSLADKKYLELFGNCWGCDRVKWQHNEMTLQEFERREKESVK